MGDVAIKTVVCNGPVALRGIELLKRSDHPNIVKVLATTRQENICKIYTEWTPIGTLRCIRPNRNQILKICAQLLSAIKYLRETFGAQHHKIDMDNVLVYDNDVVKLCGFCTSLENLPKSDDLEDLSDLLLLLYANLIYSTGMPEDPRLYAFLTNIRHMHVDAAIELCILESTL
jgi:serine/threonine protein kinase